MGHAGRARHPTSHHGGSRSAPTPLARDRLVPFLVALLVPTRLIGRAGARTTIARHGVAFFRGIVAAKGWDGSRTPELAADLAGGGWLADLAA